MRLHAFTCSPHVLCDLDGKDGHRNFVKKKIGHKPARRAQTPATTRSLNVNIAGQRRAQTADGGMRVSKRHHGPSVRSKRRPNRRLRHLRAAQEMWTANHVGPSTTHTNNLRCARLLARLPGQIASAPTTTIKTTGKNMYGYESEMGFRRAQRMWNGPKKPEGSPLMTRVYRGRLKKSRVSEQG